MPLPTRVAVISCAGSPPLPFVDVPGATPEPLLISETIELTTASALGLVVLAVAV